MSDQYWPRLSFRRYWLSRCHSGFADGGPGGSTSGGSGGSGGTSSATGTGGNGGNAVLGSGDAGNGSGVTDGFPGTTQAGGAGGVGAGAAGSSGTSAAQFLAGGGGGGGGAHAALVTTTATNSVTLIGGAGGTGGNGNGSEGVGGGGGAGGYGVVVNGSGLTDTSSGTISGGPSGDDSTRANAITFTGGSNTLTLQSGSIVIGNIEIDNGGSVTFDQTPPQVLSNVIAGNGSIVQNGTGTLSLAGASTYSGGTPIPFGRSSAPVSAALSRRMPACGSFPNYASPTATSCSTFPIG